MVNELGAYHGSCYASFNVQTVINPGAHPTGEPLEHFGYANFLPEIQVISRKLQAKTISNSGLQSIERQASFTGDLAAFTEAQ